MFYSSNTLTCQNNTKDFDYGYNARSEVTSANQTGNTNYQYGFNYDNIGNRISANENGSNKNYITNNLNQYTSNTGFTPSYDLDGNQKKIKTSTGEWEVTYNGENRPVKFIQGDKTLEMKYDYMGRRVELLSKEGSLVRKHSRFMYKDYTLTQELSNTNTVSSAFIWDPTAGMATKPLIFKYDNSAFYYTHDGNKNVTELISSDNSNLVCHYEYSPFGQTVVSAMTSPQPIPGFIFTYPAYDKLNPFRFSSEYHDDELGLVYYNYRHYNSIDGKWLSRDPIEEQGGWNLYGMVKNNLSGRIDYLGLNSFCNKVDALLAALLARINMDMPTTELAARFSDNIDRVLADVKGMTQENMDFEKWKDYAIEKVAEALVTAISSALTGLSLPAGLSINLQGMISDYLIDSVTGKIKKSAEERLKVILRNDSVFLSTMQDLYARKSLLVEVNNMIYLFKLREGEIKRCCPDVYERRRSYFDRVIRQFQYHREFLEKEIGKLESMLNSDYEVYFK